MERDDKMTDTAITTYAISTHTLTWSVTVSAVCGVKITFNFNSHAHVERDNCFVNFFKTLLISTHTLTWSVTGGSGHCGQAWNFNSHAHVERDDFKRLDYFRLFISTHTLTWSVTMSRPPRTGTVSTFQLTRSRGA